MLLGAAGRTKYRGARFHLKLLYQFSSIETISNLVAPFHSSLQKFTLVHNFHRQVIPLAPPRYPTSSAIPTRSHPLFHSHLQRRFVDRHRTLAGADILGLLWSAGCTIRGFAERYFKVSTQSKPNDLVLGNLLPVDESTTRGLLGTLVISNYLVRMWGGISWFE